MQEDGWTFPILLLNYANMIGEHYETIMKILYGCPFEKIHFLPKIAYSHYLDFKKT
jgi:hypothetical protein